MPTFLNCRYQGSYPFSPATNNVSGPDSIRASSAQMAPSASQSVVTGGTMVTSPVESG